jgi:hypothetical protein
MDISKIDFSSTTQTKRLAQWESEGEFRNSPAFCIKFPEIPNTTRRRLSDVNDPGFVVQLGSGLFSTLPTEVRYMIYNELAGSGNPSKRRIVHLMFILDLWRGEWRRKTAVCDARYGVGGCEIVHQWVEEQGNQSKEQAMDIHKGKDIDLGFGIEGFITARGSTGFQRSHRCDSQLLPSAEFNFKGVLALLRTCRQV